MRPSKNTQDRLANCKWRCSFSSLVAQAVKPRDGGNLSREQFIKVTENIVEMGSFSFGKAASDVLMVLFGAPACALLAKRIVPGLKSFSDDVVIPAATSDAVVYLAKTNKL